MVMAESIASGVVTPLTSLLLDPLVRQFSYVVKVGEKVKDLKAKMEDLNKLTVDIQSDIRSEVEEAEKRDQPRRCAQQLEGWLERVPPMADKVSDIKIKYEKLGRWCFGRCPGDIISMYKVGRIATRKLTEVTDLYRKLEEAMKSGSLTQALPSPPGHEMPGTSNLVATESNLDKVLGYLAVGVGVVGIFGMGGVGKTTLLKSVNKSILSPGGNVNSNSAAAAARGGGDEERRLRFDHVIWVTVSRDGAEVRRLQDVIAKQLKLTLPTDDKSSWASKIFKFLRNKRFALLLDDIWEGLDLDAIGVPDVGGRRVVVFTTRCEDVCGAMKAESKVKVEVLTPENAWRLFQENARNEHIKSHPGIEKLARQIAEECRGLPLAIITIGRAMSTKKTSGEWRHALKSLKDSKLAAAIPEANAEIMTSLKFSYDNLVDDKTRECFLCCALFPEYYHITKGELIACLLGHGVIDSDEFSDIGGMYDYGESLIGRLTSACLLESTQDFVKMHDIIRDMALWIANDCKMDSSRWIVRAGLESEEPLKESDKWESAHRISLMLNKMITLPEPKHQSCPHLSTLMIQRNELLERIPETFFRHFPKLTFLDMSRTRIKIFPEDVTMLIHLQYLNLSCTDIESLSLNLKALTKLRYLILRSCPFLQDIPQGSMSSLRSLQVLDLYGSISFDLSINPMDTKVEELKRLKGRTKALGLDVKLQEFSSLDEYVNRTTIWKSSVYGCSSDSCPVRDTLIVGENIQILWLKEFSSLQELTMTSDDQDGHFPRLRVLGLSELCRLEKIMWKRPTTPETFPELRTIQILSCQITDVSWIRHATRLDDLHVAYCEALSDIIIREEDEKGPSLTFRNLRSINLIGLPRLRNIYEGTIYCPSLVVLRVEGCEGLTRLPFNNVESHMITSSSNNRRLIIDAKPDKWWGALKWEDDNIKSQLGRFV